MTTEEDPRLQLDGLFGEVIPPAGSGRHFFIMSSFLGENWTIKAVDIMTKEWYERILTKEDMVNHMHSLGIAGDGLPMYCARIKRAFLSEGVLVSFASSITMEQQQLTLTILCFLDSSSTTSSTSSAREITHVYTLQHVNSSEDESRMVGMLSKLIKLSIRAYNAENSLILTKRELNLARLSNSGDSGVIMRRRKNSNGNYAGLNSSSLGAAPSTTSSIAASLAKRKGLGLVNPTAKRTKPTGAKIVGGPDDVL